MVYYRPPRLLKRSPANTAYANAVRNCPLRWDTDSELSKWAREVLPILTARDDAYYHQIDTCDVIRGAFEIVDVPQLIWMPRMGTIDIRIPSKYIDVILLVVGIVQTCPIDVCVRCRREIASLFGDRPNVFITDAPDEVADDTELYILLHGVRVDAWHMKSVLLTATHRPCDFCVPIGPTVLYM